MLRTSIPAQMLRRFTMLWKALVSASHLHDFWPRRRKGHLSTYPLSGWMSKQRISPSRSDNNTVGDQFLTCDWDGLCSSGSDKEAILDLVTSRSNAQRQEIISAYKCSFGKVQEHHLIITFILNKIETAFAGMVLHAVILYNFRQKYNFVSPGPDWWSEVWADRQVWASHRQSDEDSGLPWCQRNPRCSKSKTFTSQPDSSHTPVTSNEAETTVSKFILWFQGVGTNERCLIEVMSSRTNKQIHDMVAAYKDGKAC